MSEWDFDFRSSNSSRTFDRMAPHYSSLPLPLRPPPGSFGRDQWHNLNEELTQNVDREFPPYAEDAGSVFEEDQDVFQSTASLIPKQEPSEKKIKVEDEKLDDSSIRLATPVPPNRGYMGRESPFALDFPHSDMSFTEWFPKGDATITFPNELGEVDSISGLHAWAFEERCPLLAQSFEDSRSGPRLHLETLTPSTARPFLRYVYTGTYALPGQSGDMYEDVPTSVLLHCQLYRLGDIYDLIDLKQQANVNVTRQCEFGCSSPDKPIDLCAAIEFVYKNLRDHKGLIDTIICYCVTCFLRHDLEDDPVFQVLAYRLREFNQDLCRESMKREFEDEAAAAIIRMPFEPYIPETYASREDIGATRFNDVVYHFHGNDEIEQSPKKRKHPEMAQGPGPGISGLSLALRLNREKRQLEVRNPDPVPPVEEPDCKRRASMVSETSNEAAGTSSESEYEVVPGPAPVEELSSESDSDTDTLVMVERPASLPGTEQRELPIRRRSAASSMTLVEREPTVDSGSDSEWSMV